MADNQAVLPRLDRQFAITNPDGTPTELFMRIFQDTATDQEARLDGSIRVGAGSGLKSTGGTLGEGAELSLDSDLNGLNDVSITSPAHGDILFYDGSNYVNLAPDNGKYLKSNGTGADPTWATPPSGGGGGGGFELGVSGPPTVSEFTWYNQGTATATDTSLALKLRPQNSSQFNYLMKAAPAGNFTYYMRATRQVFHSTAAGYTLSGIALRNTSNNRIFLAFTGGSSGVPNNDVSVRRMNGPSSTVTQLVGGDISDNQQWFKIEVAGTNILTSISSDGLNWQLMNTEPVASWIGTINEVGFFAYSDNANAQFDLLVHHFSSTPPA